MKEFYSPEQVHTSESSFDADERAVVERLKWKNKERYEALERAELQLKRVFADNPEPLYRKENLIDNRTGVAFWQVDDLFDALVALEDLKHILPKRYAAAIAMIRDHAQSIKTIFDGYLVWGRQEDSLLEAKAMLVDVLVMLRRIDRDRFGQDLVELSDEDFRYCGRSAERRQDTPLLKQAIIAELDPTRFRRLFYNEYSAERIARMRSSWSNSGWEETSQCLVALDTIERALREDRSEEHST